MDELPELDEIYLANPKAQVTTISDAATTPQSRHTSSPTGSAAIASVGSDGPTFEAPWSCPSFQSPTQVTLPSKRRRTNESDRSSFASIGHPSPILSRHGRGPSFENPSKTPRDDGIDSIIRATDFSEPGPDQSAVFESPAKVQDSPFASSSDGVWPHANVQEACLMRYFIDELACWVCTSICSIRTHLLTISV